MKYRQDYDRVNFGNPKAKEIVVSFRMAQEIAQHEKTRRGAQVKIYLEHQKRWKASPNAPARTDLMAEELINATAATT